MTWWLWVLVGLGLLGLEALTPGGFFVLFFGLAAAIADATAEGIRTVAAAIQTPGGIEASWPRKATR